MVGSSIVLLLVLGVWALYACLMLCARCVLKGTNDTDLFPAETDAELTTVIYP